MKRRITTLLLCATLTLIAYSQNETTIIKPKIEYSASSRTYILGGLTIDGSDEYSEQELIDRTDLSVGQTFNFPKVDGEILP